MIQAKLTYRDFVSAWTVAMEFARVEFYGDKAMTEKLSRLANCVEYEKYEMMRSAIGSKKTEYERVKNQIAARQYRIKEIKKDVFYFLKSESMEEFKRLKGEIAVLDNKRCGLGRDIDSMEDNMFYDVRELKSRYANMLSSLGFGVKTIVHDGNHDYDIEVYEFPYEDAEHLTKLDSKIYDYLIKVNALDCHLKELGYPTNRRTSYSEEEPLL